MVGLEPQIIVGWEEKRGGRKRVASLSTADTDAR